LEAQVRGLWFNQSVSSETVENAKDLLKLFQRNNGSNSGMVGGHAGKDALSLPLQPVTYLSGEA
jgi:hypothetical protein